MDRMERLSESIDNNHELYTEERDAFATSILGSAEQLSFDANGRVLLPDSLIAEANIKDSAVFVGKGQTFEIWEPKAFEAYAEEAREVAKKNRDAFRLQTRIKEGRDD